MKNPFVLFVLVPGVLLTSGHAATNAGYQPHPVQVNLKKHVLDVDLPGDRTLQMAIESHTGVKSVSGSLDK